MKRGHLTPGQLLAILAVIFFVATAGLLSVVSFQADRLAQKDELVRDLSKEIRWHRYVADRAVKRIPDITFPPCGDCRLFPGHERWCWNGVCFVRKDTKRPCFKRKTKEKK